jgi:uncharacterized protein YbjT (DUF2867 family)
LPSRWPDSKGFSHSVPQAERRVEGRGVSGHRGRFLGGAFAVEQLLDAGQCVRALVERGGARSERLRDLGAEIVLGRLSDPAALTMALRGVRRACFAAPAGAGLPEAAALFARLAEGAGVETLVHI